MFGLFENLKDCVADLFRKKDKEEKDEKKSKFVLWSMVISFAILVIGIVLYFVSPAAFDAITNFLNSFSGNNTVNNTFNFHFSFAPFDIGYKFDEGNPKFTLNSWAILVFIVLFLASVLWEKTSPFVTAVLAIGTPIAFIPGTIKAFDYYIEGGVDPFGATLKVLLPLCITFVFACSGAVIQVCRSVVKGKVSKELATEKNKRLDARNYEYVRKRRDINKGILQLKSTLPKIDDSIEKKKKEKDRIKGKIEKCENEKERLESRSRANQASEKNLRHVWDAYTKECTEYERINARERYKKFYKHVMKREAPYWEVSERSSMLKTYQDSDADFHYIISLVDNKSDNTSDISRLDREINSSEKDLNKIESDLSDLYSQKNSIESKIRENQNEDRKMELDYQNVCEEVIELSEEDKNYIISSTFTSGVLFSILTTIFVTSVSGACLGFLKVGLIVLVPVLLAIIASLIISGITIKNQYELGKRNI